MKLLSLIRPRIINYIVEKKTKSKISKILGDKDKHFKKEIKKLNENHLETVENLTSKHELELTQKDSTHEDALNRLQEEFNNKYEKLKQVYFVSNTNTQDLQEQYNEGMLHINFLEKEFHSIISQLKHHDEYLTDKIKQLLVEIIRAKSAKQDIVDNFEKIKNLTKRKIQNAFKKKRRNDVIEAEIELKQLENKN